jgi:hypothetical protein
MTRSNNVCYRDDDSTWDRDKEWKRDDDSRWDRDKEWKRDDDSRWDRDRKRDKDDRLLQKIKLDEEKERNDKFNFWIYVAFIVLGIILLVVIIYAIVSLFQKKETSYINTNPSQTPVSIQQQNFQPSPPSSNPLPIVNKSIFTQPSSSLPSSAPKSILKKPSIFDKVSTPSPVVSPASIPFPSVSSPPATSKVNKGFLSSVNDKTEKKSFISSFLSPIVERNLTPPVMNEVKKGGWKKMINYYNLM